MFKNKKVEQGETPSPPSHLPSQPRPPRKESLPPFTASLEWTPSLFLRVIFLIHEGSVGPSRSPSLFHLTSLAIPCAKAP